MVMSATLNAYGYRAVFHIARAAHSVRAFMADIDAAIRQLGFVS